MAITRILCAYRAVHIGVSLQTDVKEFMSHRGVDWACVQEVAALQGTAQGGKRYRLTEEVGAELRSATQEQITEAEMQPQHAPLKQRPADGARPAKAYRGEYSRVEAVNENDNGVGLVCSTTALAGSFPGDFPAHILCCIHIL